jgi:5-bromo-4-chloroindolyl phosphate hydrolysis protein
MLEFVNSTSAQIILGLAGLTIFSVVGVYIIARVRNEWIESASDTSDMLSNFRELKESGELSDKEYRTIKGMLSEKFSRELNDSGEQR